MIVQTLADAIQVEQFLQNAGATNIGVFANYTRDQIIDMIRDPFTVIAVRAPDGALVATAQQITVGTHNLIVIVSLLQAGTPSSRLTLFQLLRSGSPLDAASQALLDEYKGLLLDFCNEAVSRGAGNIPTAWGATRVGQMVAQLLGTIVRTFHYADANANYFWTTPAEAIASGTLN